MDWFFYVTDIKACII